MKKRYKNIYGHVLLIILILSLFGCKKYLDAIPDKSLVVPSTLQDLQAIIDDNGDNNRLFMGLGEASADNYYLFDADWASFGPGDQNTYIWGDELFFSPGGFNEWQFLYKSIYNANLVLDNIGNIQRDESNQADWDNIKGSALFLRARAFHILVTTFSKAYDSVTALTDFGIPLRLSTDFNQVSVRASVDQSYNQIIQDLDASVSLLSVTPTSVMRPSKPAAYAQLSRTYLSMRLYNKAGLYADSALQLKNDLMDYNGGPGVNGPGAPTPFTAFNPEVIFNANGFIIPILFVYAKIDSNLYNSYDSNDLRRELFFNSNGDGTYAFKGNYFSDVASLFYGLATDELYLTKSECLARQGDAAGAISILNTLMIKRWKSGTFLPFTAIDQNDALNKILTERRKELLMRNIRWMDIKRLNKEGANISLERIINGQSYNLPPNDNRFALPLPEYVINLTGMPQNPR